MNSGAFDPADAVADALAGHPNAWLHVDGAFGLWLNQVLVRFTPPDGRDGDAFTREVMARVQEEGEAWMGGTTWHGKGAMRISVSNWSTTEADIDRTADAILRAVRT